MCFIVRAYNRYRYHHNVVLDLMLKASTKGIDMRQENGLTALELAAIGCRLAGPDASVFKLLLRAGANASSLDPSKTPVETCQKRDCPACVETFKVV
jgi:ankyrin repeat protein